VETVIHEIKKAIATLRLDQNAVRQLPPAESEATYREALKQFVSSGDRRWWWEAFDRPCSSAAFESGDGWRHIPQIAPNPDELVWFIAEDSQLPHYPVFETSPRVASQVIGECYGFEYYLVSKDYSWLVCETHHNVVFVIGDAVEARLAAATA
jgi:hypothetical protein